MTSTGHPPEGMRRSRLWATPRPASRLRGRRGGILLAGAVAAGAAATALAVHRRARRAEQESPPPGRFIAVDGVRLHYVERGEGQPVVLLHGNGAMVQDFAISGLLDGLAARYRVVAFDRPGFGYSARPRTRIWTPTAQADLLHLALDRLGIRRPIVVGHSWGTLVALALALRSPSDVRALVLMSGYYFPTVRPAVLLLAPPAIPILGDILRYTISPLLGRLLWPSIIRRLFAPAPVPARFAAVFPKELALRPSQLRAAAAETALMIPSAIILRRRYGDLAVPAMILGGAGDRIVDSDRQSAGLHRALLRSELRLATGAGHMVHHAVPEQVVEAIDAMASA